MHQTCIWKWVYGRQWRHLSSAAEWTGWPEILLLHVVYSLNARFRLQLWDLKYTNGRINISQKPISFVYNVYIRVYQLLKKLSYKSPFREEMTSYLYWSGIREYRGHFLYIYLSYCYLFVLKENQPIKSQIQFIPSIKYLADLYLIKKENLPHPISVACKPIWSHYVGLLYVMIVKTTLRPLYPGMWSFLLRTFELSCSLPFVTLCKTMTSKQKRNKFVPKTVLSTIEHIRLHVYKTGFKTWVTFTLHLFLWVCNLYIDTRWKAMGHGVACVNTHTSTDMLLFTV